jgi:site-specific DNA recombinase
VAVQIEHSLEHDQLQPKNRVAYERARLEQRLDAVRRRMDQAYTDKLDGKISEDFWQRKMIEWQAEEQRTTTALTGLQESSTNDRLLDAKRILELANKAYFLYLTRKPAEQAQLLKMVLLNCAIDGANLYPISSDLSTYEK